jgi:hypothetical protein
MTTSRHRLSRPLGLTLMAATLFTLAGALMSPAEAVTGCGHTCDGKDPNTYVWNGATCGADAVTKSSASEPGGSSNKVELRYSPRCRTAWGRGRSDYTIDVYSYYSNGSQRAAADSGYNLLVPGSNSNWTAMVNDAGYTARACMTFWSDYDRSDTTCTNKY